MSQVFLINPPYRFKKDGSNTPFKGIWKPLGILYLATILNNEGIETKAMDLVPIEINIKDVLKEISKEKPLVIGLTGTTPQIKGIVQLGKAIKERFKDRVKLGLGGPEASSDQFFLKSFPFFDFVLIGDGEITFPKIVKKIINKEKIDRINYGEIVKDLDKLPFPDRSLLADEPYKGTYGSNFVNMHTSRGCPFNCIYCSSPVESRSATRFRSPQNVLTEIQDCILKYQTKFVIFTDDTFTLRKDRVEEICQEILKRKININWNCETRANLVDEKMLRLMKKAGCNEIYFGVESGSERIRNEIINKKVTNKEIFDSLSICRKIGITTNIFLMVGFPTETEKELQETFDFPFKAKPDIIGIHLTSIQPGSLIFDQSVKEKRIKPTVWHDYAKGKIDTQPIYIPKDLTLEKLENLQSRLYRKFYFRPAWIIKRLKSSLTSWSRMRDDIDIALRLIIKGNSRARSPKESDY